MSAEFLINFKDPRWLSVNFHRVKDFVTKLPTFAGTQDYTGKDNRYDEVWLFSFDPKNEKRQWNYDARFLFNKINKATILFEVSAHPESIEKDLSYLFSWIRKQTSISIDDEDGEPSGW